MNNSEKNRTIYYYAKRFLIEHLPDGMSEEKLGKYFVGDEKESDELLIQQDSSMDLLI